MRRPSRFVPRMIGRPSLLALAASLLVTAGCSDGGPRSHPPAARDASISTAEDTAIAVALTATDEDGDALTFAISRPPTHGTLTGTPPSVVYTPAPNYHGPDAFTFSASDGESGDAGVVSVTVTSVNDPPVAVASQLSTSEDVAVAVRLSGDDVDGDSLTVAIVTQPAHGTLSGAAPDLLYTPSPKFHGSDGFTFTVSDGSATSSPAQVSIAIASVNEPPVAADDAVATPADTAASIDVLANDADGDGDTLSMSITAEPQHGTASVAEGLITYTPPAGWHGPDRFTYRASDGTAADDAEVYVSVLGPPGSLSWARSAGGWGGMAVANGIASLPDGSFLVTGGFAGHVVFGAGEPRETALDALTGVNVFVARYHADGTLAWVRQDGGAGHPRNLGADQAFAIAAFADGSCVVVGSFYAQAVFGKGEPNETTLTAYDETDVFVARYGTDGKLAWAKGAGGLSDYEVLRGVAALPDGSAIAIGRIDGSAIFGRGEPGETRIDGGLGTATSVARYAPDGQLVWARAEGRPSLANGSEGWAIAPLADGGFVLAGSLAGHAVFGAGQATETTLASEPFPLGGWYSGGYVARYAGDGTLAWARPSGYAAYGIAALPDGTSVATGWFRATSVFGAGDPNETSLTANGESDIYVARFDPAGRIAWARRAGSGASLPYEFGLAVALEADGSALVAGGFLETATFGPGEPGQTTLTSASFMDPFFARYAPDGGLEWARSARGPVVSQYDQGRCIALAPEGGVLAGGMFVGDTVFGAGEPNETVLSSDIPVAAMFVARLDP